MEPRDRKYEFNQNSITFYYSINNIKVTVIFRNINPKDKYGEYNPFKTQITIDYDFDNPDNNDNGKIQKSLQHEIIHCLFDLYSLDIYESNDFEHKFIMIFQNYKDEIRDLELLIYGDFLDHRRKVYELKKKQEQEV